MVNQSTPSNEIIAIRNTVEPEKVIDEGDSLGLESHIHSFYWAWDVYKRHDYEPVCISKKDNCCLTRAHYNGIVIWQDYVLRDEKPIVRFTRGFHTPILCSKHKPYFVMPDDATSRIFLTGYFLPRIRSVNSDVNSNADDNYNVVGYSNKMVDEKVPKESQFNWNDLKYCVTVVPIGYIKNLAISETLKNKLMSL